MTPKLPKIKKSLIAGLLVISCLLIGYGVGRNGFVADLSSFPRVHVSREVPIKDLDFTLFWKVWDRLGAQYFDKTKINQSKMVYGAIQGMVSSLGDPYTMFLPPDDNKITNENLQGDFDGVGIELGFKDTQLAVISPLPGSPAEKAGVKPGDLIVGIKDTAKNVDVTTDNITLAQAVTDIRGKSGTKVTLTLIRQGSDKPIVVDLIRDKINVPSVATTYVGDGNSIAHISILKFGGETMNEWQKAVTEVTSKKDIKGIIIDLRNNPGGYLQDSIDIAGEFVPKGTIAVIQQSADGTKNELRTEKSFGAFINSKVVVLVNGGSASASEILAGALRDDRKIQLIGDKTFGKGTIQEPEDLDNGAGIHITIAKWLTPNGTWVHGKGLEPDIKVSDNPDTKNDEQLDQAIKTVLSL